MTTSSPSNGARPVPQRTSNRVAHIRPSAGWFDLQLEEIWRHKGLLMTLVQRDIQILYKQAALGAAWAVIQPVFAVAIFTVVFGILVKVPTPGDIPYPIFAFAAVLPWNYFAESVRRGSNGLVTEGELVRKIYFPRILIPLASVIAPLVDFAIGFGVLLIMMIAFGVPLSWNILAVIPLALIVGFLALGVTLWLAPINARYRDVKHTVPFLIQIWMYASPVVYSLQMVPEEWKWLYSLNPLVGVIEGFRWAVLNQGAPDLMAIGMSLVLIAALVGTGLIFFRKNEHSFADLI